MDNQRLLVWAAFGLMAWITFQTWQQDYGPKPAAAVTDTAEVAATVDGDVSFDLSSILQYV